LITALLVVSLATVAAVAMATRQQLDIHRTGNLLHSEQAYAYVLGAESWARVVLARDLNDSDIDSLQEDWATRPPVSLVEGGTVVGRILDMQGRFNVNNLVNEAGGRDQQALDSYKRLLRTLELDDALAETLADWLDQDINASLDGAEDQHYLLLEVPYRTANRRMVDISELRLVKGYDAEVMATLRPHVVALPEPTPVNVNTATAEVLTSLGQNLGLSEAESLVDTRDDEPFEDANAFLGHPAMNGVTPANGAFGVQSEWFLMLSEANIGQGRARLASLIQRQSAGTRVVRRQRAFAEPVTLPTAEPDA
jgi:general secretion pathway protein K